MQKNDIPICHLFQDFLFDDGFFVDFPVMGIYRPVKDGESPGLGYLLYSVAAEAPGRPKKGGAAALRQQGLGVQDLLGDLAAAHGFHGIVAVAMVTDLMTLVKNPLGDVRIVLDPIAA